MAGWCGWGSLNSRRGKSGCLALWQYLSDNSIVWIAAEVTVGALHVASGVWAEELTQGFASKAGHLCCSMCSYN